MPLHLGHGERSEMGSTDVLMQLMENAESEEVRKACMEAVNAIEAIPMLKNKLKRSVPVPCMMGEKLYSIIGEDVKAYEIDGYRIEKDELYMTSEEIFFPSSKIGKYYFLSEPVAKLAHNKMYKGEKTGY